MKNFKAAMFDFDGTVTKKGVRVPDQEMADLLVDLAQVMPISFCTGREIGSFKRRALIPLLAEIKPEKKDKFLENLFLIAENGSMGYDFKPEKGDFEEFYRVEWPDAIDRSELQAALTEACVELGTVFYNHHEVVVVTRAGLKPVGEESVEQIEKLSDAIELKTHEVMAKLNPNYAEHFHVGNSGLGVLICPANGDKDNGIEMFAKHMINQRGMEFEPEYRDIIVVGDNPQPGGNDHEYLKGRFGMPYSVGNLVEGAEYPLPVKDAEGNLLKHDEGTKFLIKSLLT